MCDWYADALNDMDNSLNDLKTGYNRAEYWVANAHTLLFILEYGP